MSGNFKIKTWVSKLLITCGLVPASFAANPIKTVPWNGHMGAASFTFDDAMDNQIENLTPILEEMPDVRVTFFVSNLGGNRLSKVGAGFAKLAKMGNEIGNHTNSHLQLPDLDDATLKAEVTDFAEEIEKVMADNGVTVNVTALATPFCANNDKVSSVINEHHFINRDGGWHGRNNWDEVPKWLSMQSRVWNHSETAAAELLGALDTAAFIGDFASAEPWEVQVTGPSWLVLLHHGVSDEGGMSIAPADLKKAFERALKNDLWVAPFSTVGAYHRAHFTLDAATATKTDDGYKVTWETPHPHMPASIPMKVKLNSEFLKEVDWGKQQDAEAKAAIVIEQNGKSIAPDENGVYTIEFTAKELTIRLASETPEKPDNPEEPPQKLHDAHNQPQLSQQNAQAKFTLFDINGNRLCTLKNAAVPASMPKGIYIMRNSISGAVTLVKKQ